MDKVIREGTLRLLINESTCDVVLSCSDNRLMAHKLVLSMASPVFKELLRKNPFDSTCVLILPDIKSAMMSTILDYIYTGTTVVHSHALVEFLSVAKFLQIAVDTQSVENIMKKLDCVKKCVNGEVMDCSRKNEHVDEIYSKTKPQKRLPDLLPVKMFKKNTERKMCNVVVPSPWCPRDDKSYLGDPRIVSLGNTDNKPRLEDTNNNFQMPYKTEEDSKNNSTKLHNIIRHLYINKDAKCFSGTSEIMSNGEVPQRLELPKFTNFPFSRHLTELVPLGSKYIDNSPRGTLPKPIPIYPKKDYDSVRNLSFSPFSQPSSEHSSPTRIKPLKKLPFEPPDVSSEAFSENSNSLQSIVNEEISQDNSFSSETSNEVKKEENVKRKNFKCGDCGKCFSQLRNYKYHRSVHEGTKEFSAKCPECGKTFNDRGYLSSHMKIHRDRKEYACPNCPKRFNQRVAYNMHLRIHTGVKPHECSTCGKSFSRKMLLKQHQRVHTGERPYSCPECGKTFADRSNMSLHARLHTGVKPYACTVCPKSFTKKHHLKTHMNFHTGLKPYTCGNCGLAFSQSSNMRTHYKKCILKDQQSNSVSKQESISSPDTNLD